MIVSFVPYKQKVLGSNPCAPTRKSFKAYCFEAFFVSDIFLRINNQDIFGEHFGEHFSFSKDSIIDFGLQVCSLFINHTFNFFVNSSCILGIACLRANSKNLIPFVPLRAILLAIIHAKALSSSC